MCTTLALNKRCKILDGSLDLLKDCSWIKEHQELEVEIKDGNDNKYHARHGLRIGNQRFPPAEA